jgi:hypothetical protein
MKQSLTFSFMLCREQKKRFLDNAFISDMGEPLKDADSWKETERPEE